MARKRKTLGMASLTKKHFIGIANILCENNASNRMVNDFASYFKRANPRCDSGRFVDHVDRCKRG
jgi:hypothetical protein